MEFLPHHNARPFCDQLRNLGFAGDIYLDDANRTVYSTDNSIYQLFPLGVLCPKSSDDVVLIAELSQQPRFQNLSFCARGGGTSTNAQSLTPGFVVDLSKHMNRILEINPQGWARVEAGVVKDQLNAAAKPLGLFFAPDLSTSSRATIGGMINTDASGQGSCVYGKTRDHVLSLRTVLANGEEWTSKPLDEESLRAVRARQDRIGEIHRIADSIHKENQPAIRECFPPLNRCLTGYDLNHLRTADGRFDLNSLLCGSEGSLGYITEAVVKLEQLPKFKALAVVLYTDFIGALQDAWHLMAFHPTAIETVDGTVVALAREDESWRALQPFLSGVAQDQIAAINLVEFSGNDLQQIVTALEQIKNSYFHASEQNTPFLAITTTQHAEEVAGLWNLRKRAVGLLGNMQGDARPLPFVEDVAVPPENLAEFIRQFRQILDHKQLQYGMFGHVDAGVIHVRPALNLRDEKSLQLVREITEQVVKLVKSFGGILWGEHGKGVRSEFSPEFFGELYPQLQRIKAAFDPFNQLNPGKIATPAAHIPLLKIDDIPSRGARDRLIDKSLWRQFDDAVHCNGNGACFNWDPNHNMCPSWKVSRDRRYSPKGRANLLKEWLTRESEAGRTVSRLGRFGGSLQPQSAAANAIADNHSNLDFDDQVREAMDTCLACKACVSQCPIHVDVPEFRSAFYHHYYHQRRRPLRHHLIKYLETSLPYAVSIPGFGFFYNVLTQPRLSAQTLANITGLTALPTLSASSLKQRLREAGIELAIPERLQSLSATAKSKSVIIIQDVFTTFFDAQMVVDCAVLLQKLGFTPYLAPGTDNGKPSHVLGFLPRFQSIAQRTTKRLAALAATGIPLVGLEPSMTLTFRHEYPKFVDNPPPVMLIQEWLARQRDHLHDMQWRFHPGVFRLFAHCTEATLDAESTALWIEVFSALNQQLSITKLGCCGMAGTYGHEVAHQNDSQSLFDMSWRPALEAEHNEIVATGFSCRQQTERMADRQLPHPLQALLRQLR